MIRLDCTSCKTTLEMDDAFAGGVCRCQHCGTIQTVPAHLKGQQPDPAPAAVGATGAADRTAPPPPGRTVEGLQELASVVASSGLAGSGLRGKRAAPLKAPPKQSTKQPAAIAVAPTKSPEPTSESAPSKGRPRVMFIAGGVIVVLLAAGAWFFFGRGRVATNDAGTPGQAGLVEGGGPGFCGTPITDSTVIYLLDRGSGSRDTFGQLKEATYRSAESLGSKRKFQIMFWDNGGMETSFPTDGPTPATPDNVAAARLALENVYAFGDTMVEPPLEQAITRSPDAIVVATAKGWQLDDAFVDSVLGSRGNSNVKLHTFAIAGAGESTALKKIAEKTGGKYADVTAEQLQSVMP